jgi:putative thioredoxin
VLVVGSDEMAAFVKDVNRETFGSEVLQRSHEVPVVVDFWAAWCGPCRSLGPALEKVVADYRGAFELVKIDVDANPELASQFRVQSIPTVIAFRDGQPVSQFMGSIPEARIREFVDGVLPSESDLLVDQARTLALDGETAAAEDMFRRVLGDTPDHIEAGTGLASLLISRNEVAEALIVLGRLPRSSEVDRLEAAARLAGARENNLSELEAKLAADPEDRATRVEMGRVLAGRGEYEPALDHLLAVVKAGGEHRETARRAMVDVFEILGTGHPLTEVYRKALAAALF